MDKQAEGDVEDEMVVGTNEEANAALNKVKENKEYLIMDAGCTVSIIPDDGLPKKSGKAWLRI
jgi:hypothetical protein